MTYEEIKKNPEINAFIKKGNDNLGTLGYTDHSAAHTALVAERAAWILEQFGKSAHEIELAKIAGYMHDIGNLINRTDHSQSGAIMSFRILDKMGMPAEDIAMVITAIGNHDEGTGVPVNAISAALILADKSDVRRTRVRNADVSTFDIHDRVNYSVEKSKLTVDKENGAIGLELKIDTRYSSVMEYFEIFLGRMVLCRKAAQTLGLSFWLTINGQRIL